MSQYLKRHLNDKYIISKCIFIFKSRDKYLEDMFMCRYLVATKYMFLNVVEETEREAI